MPKSALALAPNSSVSYDVDIRALLESCTPCHGNAGGVTLSDYDSAKKNGPASTNAMRSGRMPPNRPLGASDIALFEQWASVGYPKSAGGDPGGVTAPPVLPSETGSVIYEDHIRPLLAGSCQNCHTAVANRVTFDTYDDVRRSFTMLLARVTLPANDPKHMPKGKPSLEARLIDQLRTWQSLNFPVRNVNPPVSGGTPASPYPPPATEGSKPPC